MLARKSVPQNNVCLLFMVSDHIFKEVKAYEMLQNSLLPGPSVHNHTGTGNVFSLIYNHMQFQQLVAEFQAIWHNGSSILRINRALNDNFYTATILMFVIICVSLYSGSVKIRETKFLQ